MSELASSGQLRASFLRWSLFLVPGIVLLGMLSGRLAGVDGGNAWFDALEKPSLYPPFETFGIVWAMLYVLMGIALAMVVGARGASGRKAAIGAFIVQLVLNLVWSPLFFGAHQITGALVLLFGLDIAVVVTMLLFWNVRPVAAWLLAPYLAWILFATYLNADLRLANPQLDGQEISNAAARVEF